MNSSTKRKNWVLNLLGIVIVKQPEHIRKLLRGYGINTSNKPKAKELVSKVIYAIDSRGVDFHLELAMLLSQQLQQTPLVQQYHFYQTADKEKQENQDAQEDAYVGLILGAVSGIASTVKNIKTKKQRRAEASQEMLANIRRAKAYEAQQAQMATQIAAQNATKKRVNKKYKKRVKWISTVGAIGFVSLAVWLVYQSRQKEQILIQAN